MYKRGTPEYDLWRASPEYALYCKRISVAMTGKHPSAETRARQSAAKKGKHHSTETRAKIGAAQVGKRNHMYGKHHSAETLAKMRAVKMGKRFSAETCAKISTSKMGERNPFYGKCHSVEILRKRSKAMTGANNPNWHGGMSIDSYPEDWTNLLRETIRKRDNYICALCEKPQNKRRHAVHHINYIKEDLRPENLITLCTVCHLKTNDDREHWENLFKTTYIPDFPKERMMRNESCC